MVKRLAAQTGLIVGAVVLGSFIGYVVLKQRQVASPAPSAAVQAPPTAKLEATKDSPSHRLKKQDTSPAPREVSMWETNSTSPAISSARPPRAVADRKSTRLNSSHVKIS